MTPKWVTSSVGWLNWLGTKFLGPFFRALFGLQVMQVRTGCDDLETMLIYPMLLSWQQQRARGSSHDFISSRSSWPWVMDLRLFFITAIKIPRRRCKIDKVLPSFSESILNIFRFVHLLILSRKGKFNTLNFTRDLKKVYFWFSLKVVALDLDCLDLFVVWICNIVQ